MPVSNFTHGFVDGLTVRGMPITILHPGKVFFVGYDNTGSAALAAYPGRASAADQGPGTFLRPWKTLDYAIGQCVANRGDIICLLPGHTEDIDGASGITSDVAGVAIVGLGTGSLMPTISFQAAASTHVISAADQTFVNLKWSASFADVTQGLDVSGVDGLTWAKCEFVEEAADLNFVDTINLATGADNLWWEDCIFIGDDASNDAFVTGVAHDRFVMKNCYFAANTAQTTAHGLVDSSGNVTNTWIEGCAFRSNIDGALWVDFNGAANGGIISNCYVSSIDAAGAISTLDFTGGHAFEVYVSGEADAYGLVGGGTAVYNNA